MKINLDIKVQLAWEQTMKRIERNIDYHAESLKLNPNTVLTMDLLKSAIKKIDIGNESRMTMYGMPVFETEMMMQRQPSVYRVGSNLFIPKHSIVPKNRIGELARTIAT